MKQSTTSKTVTSVFVLMLFVAATPGIGADVPNVKITGFENETISLFDFQGNWRKEVPVTMLGELPVSVLSVKAEEGFLKVKVGISEFWIETTDVQHTPMHAVNLPCVEQVGAKASDSTVVGSLGVGGGRCQ